MVENITECDEGVNIKLYDHVISFLKQSCIKHLSHSFNLSKWMHAPENGIWFCEFRQLDERLAWNNDGTLGYL